MCRGGTEVFDGFVEVGEDDSEVKVKEQKYPTETKTYATMMTMGQLIRRAIHIV